jgi:hypothetical protein
MQTSKALQQSDAKKENRVHCNAKSAGKAETMLCDSLEQKYQHLT